jgi:hypothetical protein
LDFRCSPAIVAIALLSAGEALATLNLTINADTSSITAIRVVELEPVVIEAMKSLEGGASGPRRSACSADH